MTTKKSKLKRYNDLNPVEAFRQMGEEVKNEAFDQGKEVGYDLWRQLLGSQKEQTYNEQTSGDLIEGQDISFTKSQKKEQFIEAGIDYKSEILHFEKRKSQEANREIEQTMQQVLSELKQLIKSSKVLEIQFKQVAVETKPEKAGKYHVNFYEWLLSVIKSARTKVEDSSSWLTAIKSKTGKKGYWGMFKKHGTSFGLSGERVVATQTG